MRLTAIADCVAPHMCSHTNDHPDTVCAAPCVPARVITANLLHGVACRSRSSAPAPVSSSLADGPTRGDRRCPRAVAPPRASVGGGGRPPLVHTARCARTVPYELSELIRHPSVVESRKILKLTGSSLLSLGAKSNFSLSLMGECRGRVNCAHFARVLEEDWV
jgi:hypothetical protein